MLKTCQIMSRVFKTFVNKKQLYTYVPKFNNIIDVGIIRMPQKNINKNTSVTQYNNGSSSIIYVPPKNNHANSSKYTIVPNITDKNENMFTWLNNVEMKELASVTSIGKNTAKKIVNVRPITNMTTLRLIYGFGDVKYFNCLYHAYLLTKYK